MATHHVRHPSHHSKRSATAHARPSRPAPLSKRSHSYGKGASKTAHQKEPEAESWDDEESMAVSFLNFWYATRLILAASPACPRTNLCDSTVCEKQIITPSNSILYCSERYESAKSMLLTLPLAYNHSCRKTDTEKSLTYALEHYSPPTTPFSNFSFEDLHFRDIVPQRSPTQPDSKRSSCAFSDISSDDNTWSINDKSHAMNSDASRYLRQFQSAAYSAENVRSHRPRYSRASTSQVSFSAAPSLTHTPASSISYSLPFTPAMTRPLPPRNNPHGSSYGSKSIDLVTPLTAPSSPKSYSHKTSPISTTSTSTIEGEIVYAKSPVPSLSAANGSLGWLLASTPRA
jgi:hypothetical protein